MDIYLTDPLWQILFLFLSLGFTVISVKKPATASLFLPIILPFYLIKFSLGFAFDFLGKNSFVIATNLLEIIMVIFILLNLKLAWQGIRFLRSSKLGKFLVFSILILLLSTLFSVFFGVNVRTALGVAKSWFFLPIFLFFTLLPFLKIQEFRQNFLYSIGFSGIITALMSLPFLLQNLLAYDGRLSGIFLSPNHLAMALVPGILALLINLPRRARLLAQRPSFLRRGQTSSPYNRVSPLASAVAQGEPARLTRSDGVPESARAEGFISRYHYIICYFFLTLELFVLYFTYSYGTWLGLAAAYLTPFLGRFPSPNTALPVILSDERSEESKDPSRILKRDSRPDDSPVGRASTSRLRRVGRNDNKWLFVKIITGLMLVTVLIFSQLHNPKLAHILNGDYYSSLHSRLMIWQSAWKISQNHWLFGIGGGNFQQAYLDYQKYFSEPYIEWAVPMPHNIFLAFLVQLGIFGLLSFVFIIITTAIVPLSVILKREFVTLSPSTLLRVNSARRAESNGSLFLKRDSSTSARDDKTAGILKIDKWKLIENWKLKIRNFRKGLHGLDSLSIWAIAYLLYFVIHGLTDTPYWKNDLAVIFWLALATIWATKPTRITDYESRSK